MFLLSYSEQIMPFCVFIYSLIVVFTLSFGSAKAETLSFPSYTIETVAKGLDYPWALAFLPNGDLLVTERTGQIRIVSQNTVSEPLVGLLKDIYV